MTLERVYQLTAQMLELQDRESRLRTLLDAIPLHVAHVSADEKILYGNRAFETFTGCSLTDLRGRTLQELFRGNYTELRPYVLDALRGRASESIHEFTQPDGARRLILIQRVPDRREDGRVQGYFTVGADVTDRTHGEAERQRREQELRDALIAEVHHRVQNNLQSIVALLRQEVHEHPDLSRMLQPAIAKVMAVSVGFGLMSSSAARGLNLCDMTREIARNLAEVTGARIETNLDDAIRAQPLKVEARYAVNVALVINELMLNAIKHSPARGSPVTVSVILERSLPAAALVRIFSAGAQLPRDFDFDAATGLRTGLRLVRLLIPAHVAKLKFASGSDGVSAELYVEGVSSPPTLS